MIKHLTENVLPFWLDNAIDEEFGGIFTQLDREGKIYGTEKSVWFQGRALYIFASAWNYGLKDEKYLHAAKKIYEFLPLCGDESYRMAFTVTREARKSRREDTISAKPSQQSAVQNIILQQATRKQEKRQRNILTLHTSSSRELRRLSPSSIPKTPPIRDFLLQ